MPTMKTKTELLKDARSRVPEVQPLELSRQSPKPVILDVREKQETDAGMLPGAKHVPRGYLELRIEETVPDRGADVVLYCAGGTRSLLAAKTLAEMGYTRVRSMAGGFSAWKDSGFPVETPVRLTEAQRARYSRHLMIPEVGETGQAKLLKSKVLLIGAGGLGSPAALYLAAAGVGRLGIVDDDVVDESNLQRQILHTTDRVGMPKTESAKKTLQALNPEVVVDEHRVRLNRDNALELFSKYDVIVDGSDNFGTRYLVNDACVLLEEPNVHGSIFRFHGQATTFIPGGGRPGYRRPRPAQRNGAGVAFSPRASLPPADGKALPIALLLLLLLFLAPDAHGGDRPGFQALDGDLFLADLADPERAALYPRQSVVELLPH